MAISILHVGLPLEHPLIPVEDRAKIRARLDALQRGMRAAGYEYEILCVAPDGGMEEFKAELRARGCDGVVLGGGVVGNPEVSYFMEQLVDAVHAVIPKAKIMFHSHAEEVSTTVGRWFPAPRS